MIRIVKLGSNFYGKKIAVLNGEEIEDIEIFVGEGSPIILIDSLDDLEELYIDIEDVEMVD